MSLSRLLNQPLAIQYVDGSTVDEYGNAIAAPVGFAVDAFGYLEQANSVETLTDRDTNVSAFKLWLPAGTQLSAYDRILFGFQTFEVDGEPWQVYNPRTREVSHLEANLKVVS